MGQASLSMSSSSRLPVDLHHRIVWDKPDGTLRIRSAKSSSVVVKADGTGAFPEFTGALSEVPAVTLDSVVSEACALKVDAEGSDFRVLRGATRLLKESLQIVDFEFVPQV